MVVSCFWRERYAGQELFTTPSRDCCWSLIIPGPVAGASFSRMERTVLMFGEEAKAILLKNFNISTSIPSQAVGGLMLRAHACTSLVATKQKTRPTEGSPATVYLSLHKK